MNLLALKDTLGYGVWDYLYNLKRCGIDIARREAIDCSKEVESMVADLESSGEKVVRMVMAKYEVESSRPVEITPLKQPRGRESTGDDNDESIDE